MKTNDMLCASTVLALVAFGCGGGGERPPNRDLTQSQAALGSGSGDDPGDDPGDNPPGGSGCNIDSPEYQACTNIMADCLNKCQQWPADLPSGKEGCLQGCDDGFRWCLESVPGCP